MYKKAMFGAGCFWGVEVAFRKTPGVIDTAVGYSGGSFSSPTYEDVCYKDTGHAEVVLVEFDDAKLKYPDLLEAFWKMHDPTQRDRQGHDVGSQYRSIIFAMDDNQEEDAKASMALQEETQRFPHPIVTDIIRAKEFWRAEDYHQRYLEKRGLAAPDNDPFEEPERARSAGQM
jgi:peptide-methionine (S)-S-oxide reductase